MLISTVIYNDGEERQYYAASLTIGEPSENLIRVDLGEDGETIISIFAIRAIHTQDLPEDAISPEVLGSSRP